MNKNWHDTHQLDRKATMDERIAWHLEHAAQCGCRDMPDSVRQELARRSIPAPTRKA